MARPTTKSDLTAAANTQFEKLWILISSMSEGKQNAEFAFEDRDRNLRDVLVHLHEWHNMVEKWHRIGTLEKGTPAIPGEGYTWRTLPGLNMEIWEKYQTVPLKDAKEKLNNSHQTILKLIESHSNDELFSKGVYKWTKASTLGAYFVSSNSSHYEWAMKKIKRHIKV
jgi:Uncharacterized conserved protein